MAEVKLDVDGNNGWSKIPRRITATPSKQLSDSSFRVYAAIDGLAGKQGVCRHSKIEIGRAAGGKSKLTVQRAIGELLKTGLLLERKAPRNTVGRELVVVYRVQEATPGGDSNLIPGGLKSEPRGIQDCIPGDSNLNPCQEPFQEPSKKNHGSSSSASHRESRRGEGTRVESMATNVDPAEAESAVLVARAVQIFSGDDRIPGLVAKTLAKHPAGWVDAALASAERKAETGGAVITWGYVVGALKRMKEQGGPAPKAVNPNEARYSRMIAEQLASSQKYREYLEARKNGTH